jgi:hypothetical protein
MDGVSVVTEVAQYGITGVAITLVVALFLTIKLFVGMLQQNYGELSKFTDVVRELKTEVKVLKMMLRIRKRLKKRNAEDSGIIIDTEDEVMR